MRTVIYCCDEDGNNTEPITSFLDTDGMTEEEAIEEVMDDCGCIVNKIESIVFTNGKDGYLVKHTKDDEDGIFECHYLAQVV